MNNKLNQEKIDKIMRQYKKKIKEGKAHFIYDQGDWNYLCSKGEAFHYALGKSVNYLYIDLEYIDKSELKSILESTMQRENQGKNYYCDLCGAKVEFTNDDGLCIDCEKMEVDAMVFRERYKKYEQRWLESHGYDWEAIREMCRTGCHGWHEPLYIGGMPGSYFIDYKGNFVHDLTLFRIYPLMTNKELFED